MGADVSRDCQPFCVEQGISTAPSCCGSLAQDSELNRRQKEKEARRQLTKDKWSHKLNGGEGPEETGVLATMKTWKSRMFTGADMEVELAAQETIIKARLLQQTVRSPEEDLQHGSMRGELRKVKKAMERRADVNFTNSRGVTPLMLCASSSGKEALDVLKELQEFKSDVAGKDNNGWTALHHACRNGKGESLKLLISMHADPATATKDHKTTVMLAAMEGKADLVRELFKWKTCRMQVGDKDTLGGTALHFAVKSGACELAKLLIENTARVNCKDIDYKTPLMWACEHGKLDCVRALAKKAAEVDCKDKCHRSPLLHACLNNYEGVALWLLRKTADPYANDVSGDTPLTVANDMGLSDLKKYVKMRMTEMDDDDD